MDDLERMLASEDGLEPSSGFTGRVMEAVRQDEAPLPFPWRRFGLGLAACLVAAATATLVLSQVRLPAIEFGLSGRYLGLALVSCLACRLPRVFVRS